MLKTNFSSGRPRPQNKHSGLCFKTGLGALCLTLFLSVPALAQSPSPTPPKPSAQTKLTKQLNESNQEGKGANYVSFSYENDKIGDGSDRAYTSGLRLTWFNASTPVPMFMDTLADAVPTFDINPTTSTFFTLGQNIYTPEDITVAGLQRDDRPYAGWLYGSVGLLSTTNNHTDEMELTLGVVGPPSMAEQTQEFIHDLIDTRDPNGWDNQLDFEPGVILSWRRRWPGSLEYNFGDGDYRLALEPNVNVSLGNIYTYAGTGANVTFGPYQGVLQDTPPRVAPSGPGTGYFETPQQGWSWYLFAGLDGRAIARNIFLDGNTLGDSHSVDKKYFVADANAGIAFTYGDYRLSYTLTSRTKEFDGQDGETSFGSLTLTTRF